MSDERKQSLFIIAYPEHDTADQVYKTLRALEKQAKIQYLSIKSPGAMLRKREAKPSLRNRLGSGPSFTAEEAPGNAAGRVHLLFIVHT